MRHSCKACSYKRNQDVHQNISEEEAQRGSYAFTGEQGSWSGALNNRKG